MKNNPSCRVWCKVLNISGLSILSPSGLLNILKVKSVDRNVAKYPKLVNDIYDRSYKSEFEFPFLSLVFVNVPFLRGREHSRLVDAHG